MTKMENGSQPQNIITLFFEVGKSITNHSGKLGANTYKTYIR